MAPRRRSTRHQEVPTSKSSLEMGSAPVSVADEVEPIDTEGDDSEFDERAHWGRRRASRKRHRLTGARGKRAPIEDKTQPKISQLFGVLKAPTAAVEEEQVVVALDMSEAQTTSIAMKVTEVMEVMEVATTTKTTTTTMTTVECEAEDQSMEEEEDQSMEEEADEATATATATASSSNSSSKEASPKALTPTMQSGRPKRRAVLQAERNSIERQRRQCRRQSSDGSPEQEEEEEAETCAEGTSSSTTTKERAAFLTPPLATSKAGNRVTLESKSTRKAPASSRKRKLEMASAKKKPSPSKVGADPTVFFLSQQERKQVIEIEAVMSFKEQLRLARERDLAFFSNSGDGEEADGGSATPAPFMSSNPFFQARSRERKRTDATGDAVSDLEREDSDGWGSGSGSSKRTASRWQKDCDRFPATQHVISQPFNQPTSAPSSTFAAPPLLPPLPFKVELDLGQTVTSDAIIVIDEDEDMDTGSVSEALAISADRRSNWHAELQASWSDFQWLLALAGQGQGGVPPTATDRLLARCDLSCEEWLEKLADTYEMSEKHVHNMLAALEQARTKRLDKLANLAIVDRYAPTQRDGLVGNREPLRFLSSWLSAWKSSRSDRDRRSCFQAEMFVFEGDGDDLDSDLDEEEDICRLFVLEGDVGTGKSAAVYACAEELGYEVIEINAAQNRSGKSIVDLAGEATQSTRVLHAGVDDKSSDKNRKKKKARRRSRGDAASRQNPAHLSLVLFEDIDLIFDADKGFLNTLCSIAKRSKCPIVATCKQLPDTFPSSPQILRRTMTRPSVDEFMTWLTLVADLEQLPMPQSLGLRLAELHACDVRRTLHFLQMYRPHIRGLPALIDGVEAAATTTGSLIWDATTEHIPIEIPAKSNNVIVLDDDDEGEDPAARQDQSYKPDVCVPAWTAWPERSVDVLTSNFLPQLRGTMLSSPPMAASAKSMAVDRSHRMREIARLDDVFHVLEAASMADTWMTPAAHGSKDDTDTTDDDAFFHMRATELRAMDLRRQSLVRFFADDDVETLHVAPCPLAESLSRTLDDVTHDTERFDKKHSLVELQSKLELPTVAPISATSTITSPSFSLDYLPMIARILEHSGSGMSSGRRPSRRNHYLREVLPDLALVDDITKYAQSYASMSLPGSHVFAATEDEIVASSPSVTPSPSPSAPRAHSYSHSTSPAALDMSSQRSC